MSVRLGIGIALIALASITPAQVYRCDNAETVIFSDQPCNDESAVHTPVRQISVVEPAADLDQIAERNQAFIRKRLDRQAAVRAARAESARQTREHPAQIPVQTPAFRHVPFWVEPRKYRHHRSRPGVPQEAAVPEREQRPFSALSAPFPGSRRPDRAR